MREFSRASQVRARLLIGSNADAAIGERGARVVNEGANLAIIEAKSPGDLLFRERVGGIWLASVFDLHQVTEIQAELLGGNGVATEKVKHANLVSFTCLKSFAFDQRFEREDAHDLIYCIEHAPERSDAVADAFRKELAGARAQ